jgi:hypothetical protein
LWGRKAKTRRFGWEILGFEADAARRKGGKERSEEMNEEEGG